MSDVEKYTVTAIYEVGDREEVEALRAKLGEIGLSGVQIIPTSETPALPDQHDGTLPTIEIRPELNEIYTMSIGTYLIMKIQK